MGVRAYCAVAERAPANCDTVDHALEGDPSYHQPLAGYGSRSFRVTTPFIFHANCPLYWRLPVATLPPLRGELNPAEIR